MKKFNLICLFYIGLVCSELAGQTFDNYYSIVYHNNQSESVITREDSGYTCVNYILDSASNRLDANLIWINKNGAHVKNKSLNYFNQSQSSFMQGRNYFNSFTKASYLLQGVCKVGQKQGILLSKFNKTTLDTMKTFAYPDQNNNYAINNFIKLHENKYFLIGNKWSGPTTGWVVMFEIDSNLNVVNQTQLNVPSNYANYNAIYNYHDHKILLGGHVVGSGQAKNALILIDTLGVISQSIISTNGLKDNASQYEFSATDTSYITYGSQTITPYGSFALKKLCISKYDRNLILKWQKTYGQESMSNCLHSMFVETDGSIITSGAYSQTTSLPLLNEDLNGVILKVSKEGNFRWMREYNHQPAGNLAEIFRGLDKTKENSYVACGSIAGQTKGVVWFVKTDSAGCVTPGCATSTVQVDSLIIPLNPVDMRSNESSINIKIYPNPVVSYFTVQVPESYIGNTTISVKDALGRIIINGVKILSNRFEWPLTGEDGLYFLEIYSSESQRLHVRKIIKSAK